MSKNIDNKINSHVRPRELTRDHVSSSECDSLGGTTVSYIIFNFTMLFFWLKIFNLGGGNLLNW